MADRYKVAVIGLGRIGAQMEQDALREKPASHLGAWLAHSERCEVVGVSDINQEIRNSDVHPEYRNVLWLANGAPAFPFYTDYEDLMNQAKPDIVSIATPDETHIKIARVAMRYESVKLIFLEKPIGLTMDEAQKIVDSAREFHVKLAINHTRRWSPVWRAVAAECSQSQPTFMTATMTGGSGGIRDIVHMADLANWFNPTIPLRGGPHFHFAIGAKSPYLTFEVDLFWDDKRIRVTENGRLSTMYKPRASHHYENIQELEQTCQVNRNLYPDSDMWLATKQLLSCLDKDDEPYCTGEHGKRALETYLSWT